MKLSRLIQGIGIIETNIENFDLEINSVCADSRQVQESDIFVSIKGNSYNGHKYIGEATKRRAAVIVIDDKRFSGDFPYVRVHSTRAAYAALWNNLCGRPTERLSCIAITGTNGKSSTAVMLTHILNTAGLGAESIGTLNSDLTTPDPPRLYPRLKQIADNAKRYAVMETSSHALTYCKLYPIQFKLGIFTNLTPEHLDFHGNMRCYANAKSKLFSRCDKSLYNMDDKYASYITRYSRKKYSYSFTRDRADFVCKNMESGLGQSRFDFLTVGDLFRIRMPVSGQFGIYNAMAACSAAYILGIDKEDIKRAMITLPPIPGRLEKVGLISTDYSAFIDYAHTPDALHKLLCTVRASMKGKGRLVCLFGCGGDRDKSKRAPMGEIATALADKCIITSDNSRTEDPFAIIRDILTGVDKSKRPLVIPDRRSAIKYVIHSAKEGDVILFCGKGHENYEINVYGKMPFDEKQIIQEADKERNERKGNEHYSC